jgi:general secretion pathway protein A
LINLLSERALMAGYGQAKVPIDHKMVNQAAVEVLGQIDTPNNKRWPFVVAVALVLAFGLSLYLFNRSAIDSRFMPNTADAAQTQTQTQTQVQTKTQSSVTASLTPAAVNQVTVQQPSAINAQQQLMRQAMVQSTSIENAFAGLFGLWNKQPIIGLSACQAAQQQDLACYQQQGNWHSIMRLNYPAVVYLQDAQTNVFYGVMVERQVDQILLQLGEQQFWVSKDWFDRHFSGTFEILWQPDAVIPRDISQSSSMAQVQWLENSLARVNKRPARLLTQFDTELEQQLMHFQRQHGLKPDGIAGNQTLVQLNLYLSQQGPRLSASVERS